MDRAPGPLALPHLGIRGPQGEKGHRQRGPLAGRRRKRCEPGSTDAQLRSECDHVEFHDQIAAANPGQVVCLASGDYSSFIGTSKSAPGIWITSAPGATVAFNSGIRLNLSNVQNFTLDGTGGGGTMTVGGELDMETSTDALLNKALNLTFQNINFATGGNVLVRGPENSNITFNRDTFVDGNSNSGCTSLGAQFYLLYRTATSTTQSGVTVENSVLIAPGDLWNPNRAIETMSPMTVANNVIVGFLDRLNSCNHIDGLLLYSGSPGTYGGVTFTGNLCYDDYNCIAGWDGTSYNTITDNACFSMERSCVDLYSDVGSVVSHNTSMTGGADPSGCATEPDTQACSIGQLFENSNKTGDPVGSGETFTNNVSGSGPTSAIPARSPRTPTTCGQAPPPRTSTAAPHSPAGPTRPLGPGFELTPGSTGHARGSDGLDVGVRASAGGPPTGGGSAP